MLHIRCVLIRVRYYRVWLTTSRWNLLHASLPILSVWLLHSMWCQCMGFVLLSSSDAFNGCLVCAHTLHSIAIICHCSTTRLCDQVHFLSLTLPRIATLATTVPLASKWKWNSFIHKGNMIIALADRFADLTFSFRSFSFDRNSKQMKNRNRMVIDLRRPNRRTARQNSKVELEWLHSYVVIIIGT